MAFLGFFGFLGRSHDLRQLDTMLREVDVHPKLVPEAVKLALLKIVAGTPQGRDFRAAAALLGYCVLGAHAFAVANGEAATLAQEARIERAVEAGDSIDARIVLLALHAGIVHPEVVGRYDLTAD